MRGVRVSASDREGRGPGEANAIPVVAAVIHRHDRYLVGRRPARKRHGGLWEFPGGKVRAGESLEEAARRELDEELCLACGGVGGVIWSAGDPGSEYVIHFVPARVEGEPRAVEHEAVGWFTLEELQGMALAPSDSAFVAFLRSDRGEGNAPVPDGA